MFLFVRTYFAAVATVATLLALPAPVAAAGGPSKKQIQAAVKLAARSKDLWATVNICNTRRHRNTIGIRGQMLGLGFRATMSMTFRVEYWNVAQKRYKPIAGASKSLTLGRATTGLHQDGFRFPFKPHAGLLAGVVTFAWALGNKQIAQLTRPTSKGHPDADNGDPPHYSSGNCLIK